MAPPAPNVGSLTKLPLPAKIGVGLLLTLCGGVAYYFGLYQAIDKSIEQAVRQQATLKKDLAEQQKAQATYFVDRDELTLRQQRQRELNKILPPDAEQASFLSALQQVSNISGIELKAWQPLDEQTQAFYAKVPMRIEMGGKFHQLVKFTLEVGKLERIINVENIELYDAKTVGEETVIKARCLATTFHALGSKAKGGK